MISMHFKVLIVDDEEPARRELKHLLGGIADVSVVGEAANGQDAIKEILQLKPDVVFLDVQMPMGGLEVARIICKMKKSPCIVFVTAYDNFALEAYEVHATDYLLKPISEERLLQTILWIKELLEQQERQTVLSRIPVENKGHLVMMDLQDITYFCCEDDRVIATTMKGTFPTGFILKNLESRLGKDFFRCHRKYIVNLQHIHEIIPWFNGTYALSLKEIDKIEIPVSRQKMPELRKILGLV